MASRTRSRFCRALPNKLRIQIIQRLLFSELALSIQKQRAPTAAYGGASVNINSLVQLKSGHRKRLGKASGFLPSAPRVYFGGSAASDPSQASCPRWIGGECFFVQCFFALCCRNIFIFSNYYFCTIEYDNSRQRSIADMPGQ